MIRKVLAAILAAGASTRFGAIKQLVNYGTETMIEHAQSVATMSTVDQTSIILGANFEVISKAIFPDVTIVQNVEWEEGIASSIRAATRFAVSQNASHLLILLCDQPHTSTCLIDKILALSKFSPDKIVACDYANTLGVPAIFPHTFFEELLSLKGDAGAKSVIRKATDVEVVSFPAGCVDIDIPEDISGSLSNQKQLS